MQQLTTNSISIFSFVHIVPNLMKSNLITPKIQSWSEWNMVLSNIWLNGRIFREKNFMLESRLIKQTQNQGQQLRMVEICEITNIMGRFRFDFFNAIPQQYFFYFLTYITAVCSFEKM